MNNRVSGKRENVFIKKNTFLRGMRINFKGKNNEVVIGGRKPSAAKDLKIYCADRHCMVHVKEDTQISGKTELAVMEGTKIEVGNDCLFSANITLRAGDSHSVVDSETGARLNPSRDIIIGNHVWIGNTVIITKGTVIGDNSVIATGSVVSGKKYPANSAIGGNPAKLIKESISWRHQKI